MNKKKSEVISHDIIWGYIKTNNREKSIHLSKPININYSTPPHWSKPYKKKISNSFIWLIFV